MCTAMTIKTHSHMLLFGRTMDFSHPLDPEFFLLPKNHIWVNLNGSHKIKNRFHVLGIGQDISSVVLTDGVNECGFAAASLYFPGFASYDAVPSENNAAPIVASVELVKFLLGLCSNTKDAVSLLKEIKITGFEDPVTNSIAPLHWIIADADGNCMTIEKMSDGLHIYDNSIGVLSNSPDFPWHMTNLRNYLNLTPSQKENASWNEVLLKPFGQGGGAIGLPGDFTPPSRFVRCAYLKSHTAFSSQPSEVISSCFHIMENLSIPRGIVLTDRGTDDYTQYTAFIDLKTLTYYYKTYDNSQIRSVRLTETSDPQIHTLSDEVRPAEGLCIHECPRGYTLGKLNTQNIL